LIMSKIIEGIQLSEKKKKPKPTSPEKWSRAKAKARSKFDVYPSAYANAYAAKEYKKMGGGWRMGEDISEMDSQGYRGHRGDEDPGKGPEKVVKPDSPKKVAKDAEEELTKAMDKSRKKGVAEGKEPIRAYHGNQGGIDTERLHAPMWFTAGRKDAEYYAGDDGFIVVADLDISNPYVLQPGDEANTVLRGWQDLQAQGYDGIYDSHHGDWIPFSREQIRVISKDDVVAEGAAELLKAEMPLVRHIEKELTGHGYVKGTPEYNEHFKHALAYYRKFGNVDAIKKGVAEDTTMQFAAEKLPAQNPYGGVKDRQFRGAIAETEAVNRNDGDGWRWYEPREEEQLDELKCWPGYTRVKGVPAGAVGSCKKKTKESSIMKGLQSEGK
jgi:hypothetical protein